MSILRVIPSGDMFKVSASKPDSKSWTARGQVGRFEPQGTMDVYRGLPDSVLTAYLAVPFDAPDAQEQRETILRESKVTPSTANSPIPFKSDDLIGWVKLAGNRANAGRLASHGILALPESVDVDAAIDSMFALLGIDPATVETTEAESDAEGEPEPEPNVKTAK